MNSRKQFAKTTLIIFFGKVCTQLISFFLLPLYTAYLDKQQYGIVDLIQTYVTLFVPLITMELEMSIFRWLVDNRGKDFDNHKVISNNFFILLIGLSIFTVVFFITTSFVDIPFKWIIYVDVLVCVLSGNFLQISRGVGKTLDFSISCILTGLTTVISNIILIVFLGFRADGMIISMALANFVCSLYLFIRLKLYKHMDFKLVDKALIKEMYKYSLPLVLNGVSWWIINVSDRSIITFVLGASANGIYAISNKFPTIISSLTGIINMSWSESASLNINSPNRDKFYSDVTNMMIKLFVALGAGMIACLPFVFPIMINSEFSEGYLYIPPLIIATLFNVLICLYSQIYFAKKLSKQVASITIVGAIINVVVNVLLINVIGLYAACISTMIAYLFMVVYRHFDMKKYVNIKIEKNLIIKSTLILIFSIVFYYINNLYLNIFSLIVVVIYAFISNKQFLKDSYNTILGKIKR